MDNATDRHILVNGAQNNEIGRNDFCHMISLFKLSRNRAQALIVQSFS